MAGAKRARGLDPGRAGSDLDHWLAGEVDVVMRPAARVVPVPAEGIQPRGLPGTCESGRQPTAGIRKRHRTRRPLPVSTAHRLASSSQAALVISARLDKSWTVLAAARACLPWLEEVVESHGQLAGPDVAAEGRLR